MTKHRLLFAAAFALALCSPCLAQQVYTVDPNGVDTGFCPSSAPCKTFNYAALLYSMLGGCAKIHANTGSYYETLDVVGGNCIRVGDESAGLIIEGDGPNATFWNGGLNTTGTLIVTGTSARVAIRQMYVYSTNGPNQNTIYVQQGGGLSVLDGVTFGQSTNQQLHCENVGSQIQLWQDYTIASGTLSGNHMAATTQCNISAGPLTVTLGPNLIFGSYFVFAQLGAGLNLSIKWQGGPVNGPKYRVQQMSFVTTNGAGCANLPGSSAGSKDPTSTCQ